MHSNVTSEWLQSCCPLDLTVPGASLQIWLWLCATRVWSKLCVCDFLIKSWCPSQGRSLKWEMTVAECATEQKTQKILVLQLQA